MEAIAQLFSGELSWTDIIIRVVAATIVGGIIGVEREISNHPAGFKTHALVCLGAAITSMIAEEMVCIYGVEGALNDASKVDVTRIASGVVSGIGFIGAGAIIKSKEGGVTGITTAATVWLSGCIGLAIGMGNFRITVVSVAMILIITLWLNTVEKKIVRKRGLYWIDVVLNYEKAAQKSETIVDIEQYFKLNQITISQFSLLNRDDDEENIKYNVFRFGLRIPTAVTKSLVIRDIAKMDGVMEVYESDLRRERLKLRAKK